MVTTPLDGAAAQHIDRIVTEVIATRDWEHDRSDGPLANRAAMRICAAVDFGDVLERTAA